MHEVESEIVDRFLSYTEEQEKAVGCLDNCCSLGGGLDKEYPIEYSFIDFKWLMIGEKLKIMDGVNTARKYTSTLFDDDYFAELITS